MPEPRLRCGLLAFSSHLHAHDPAGPTPSASPADPEVYPSAPSSAGYGPKSPRPMGSRPASARLGGSAAGPLASTAEARKAARPVVPPPARLTARGRRLPGLRVASQAPARRARGAPEASLWARAASPRPGRSAVRPTRAGSAQGPQPRAPPQKAHRAGLFGVRPSYSQAEGRRFEPGRPLPLRYAVLDVARSTLTGCRVHIGYTPRRSRSARAAVIASTIGVPWAKRASSKTWA